MRPTNVDITNWDTLVRCADECERMCIESGRGVAAIHAARAFRAGQLREALLSSAHLVRKKAMQMLVLIERDRALSDLADRLSNDDCPVVRHEAAFFIGTLEIPDAVDPLCKSLLNDADALVRHEAAEALGELGYLSALDALRIAVRQDCFLVSRTAQISIDQIRIKNAA